MCHWVIEEICAAAAVYFKKKKKSSEIGALNAEASHNTMKFHGTGSVLLQLCHFTPPAAVQLTDT